MTLVETPPRAWGRPHPEPGRLPAQRNTPTGVGKTDTSTDRTQTQRKHPHGRGEDITSARCAAIQPETPPRAWGRLGHEVRTDDVARNTPTGVGKTWLPPAGGEIFKKHPHGRGEDYFCFQISRPPMETPPRAWGRPRAEAKVSEASGNTPTGVGKTAWRSRADKEMEKHPHGRGEDNFPTS